MILEAMFWMAILLVGIMALMLLVIIAGMIWRGLHESVSDTDDPAGSVDDPEGTKDKGAEDEDTETEGRSAVDRSGE